MKYQVIVVDPPWPVGWIKRKERPNQQHIAYPLMKLEEIKELKVNTLANDKCICFLWTTQKFLQFAFDILKNWGFNPLLTLTWNKQNGLCLYGFHWKTEFVLVGLKGKWGIYQKKKAMPTLFSESSWRKHSQKPSIFYEFAEKFGSPRIDLFARKQRDGWDVWGNEVESDIEL